MTTFDYAAIDTVVRGKSERYYAVPVNPQASDSIIEIFARPDQSHLFVGDHEGDFKVAELVYHPDDNKITFERTADLTPDTRRNPAKVNIIGLSFSLNMYFLKNKETTTILFETVRS